MLSNPSVLSAMGDCINKNYSSEAENVPYYRLSKRAGGDKATISSNVDP